MTDPLHCLIYRSKRKDELYLFLASEEDLERIPEAIRKGLGQLEKAMELDLTPRTKLARSSVEEVIRNLSEQGFHIQLPPQITLEYSLSSESRNHTGP